MRGNQAPPRSQRDARVGRNAEPRNDLRHRAEVVRAGLAADAAGAEWADVLADALERFGERFELGRVEV